MPATTLMALLASLTWMVPSIAQTDLTIAFYDPFDRSSYQFEINEDAYIAVFEITASRVQLTYPAIGDALRDLRYGDATSIPAPDNFYEAGRHLLPQRAGRIWSGRTENAYLLKGRHILVVASRKPFTFERLNGLFVGEGQTLRRHNSFGAPEDFTNELIRTIVPDFDLHQWVAYLHWIRDE